ncbi:ABC transporter permease [Cellulomonas sp. NPDC057328]|uniref:ABC transporter permease n=1 Tax=Cellulomonas sp. NPDC057328 TaxID=3346101 RepID=UPI00363453C6
MTVHVDRAVAVATRPPVPRRRRTAVRVPPLQLLGLAMVLTVTAFALLYPLVPAYDPMTQDVLRANIPPGAEAGHWLGTDVLGRDLASRLALASRVTLGIAVLVVVATAFIGLVLGTVSGYVGGKVDTLIMGIADIQLAIPVIMVVIALAAAVGANVGLMVLVLVLTLWVNYARVARALTLSLRERDFVISPRIQGASGWWAVRKHVVPNVAVQMLVIATAELGAVILATSSFDYLGLGVQAPTPSWGSMISEGQKFFRQAPFLSLVPGATIVLVVVGVNLVSQRFTSENAPRPARRRRKERGAR